MEHTFALHDMLGLSVLWVVSVDPGVAHLQHLPHSMSAPSCTWHVCTPYCRVVLGHLHHNTPGSALHCTGSVGSAFGCVCGLIHTPSRSSVVFLSMLGGFLGGESRRQSEDEEAGSSLLAPACVCVCVCCSCSAAGNQLQHCASSAPYGSTLCVCISLIVVAAGLAGHAWYGYGCVWWWVS